MERKAIDDYVRRALVRPFNDCAWVTIDASGREGGPGWRCIGVHLLTGAENGGNHNAYIEVVDVQGNRVDGQVAQYDWEGQQPSEESPDTPLDKPITEACGNIPIGIGQTMRVWIKSVRSDIVEGITTDIPNQAEEAGSTWGHRSYLLIFVDEMQPLPVVPPAVVPPAVVPPADCIELLKLLAAVRNELATMDDTIVEAMVQLGYWGAQ